jgi:hypothetical protein
MNYQHKYIKYKTKFLKLQYLQYLQDLQGGNLNDINSILDPSLNNEQIVSVMANKFNLPINTLDSLEKIKIWTKISLDRDITQGHPNAAKALKRFNEASDILIKDQKNNDPMYERNKVLEEIKNRTKTLNEISPIYRRDREITMEALKNNPMHLMYALPEFQADKELVMSAVRLQGLAIEHVSDKLKADKDVALAAVGNNGMAFLHLSQQLKADKDVIKTALLNNKSIYFVIPLSDPEIKEFVTEIVRKK